MNIHDLPEEILLSLIEYLHIKELIELELESSFFIGAEAVHGSVSNYQNIIIGSTLTPGWLEASTDFQIRKMVSSFYKKRLYQHQLINGSYRVKETSMK